MALSKALLSPHHDHFMFQAGGIGQLPECLSSVPAMQAAVAAAIAPAAPEVTIPDSAPVNSAKPSAHPRCNSSMLTKCCAASTWAWRTSEIREIHSDTSRCLGN